MTTTYPVANATNQSDLHPALHNNQPIDFKAHFGALGNGTTDESLKFQELAAHAAANPFSSYYIPYGVYPVTYTNAQRTGVNAVWIAQGGATAVIPSHTRIFGPGVIKQKGVPVGDATVDPDKQYVVFGIDDGTTDVLIEQLTFRGENDPYTWYLNNQAACIDVLLSTTTDVTVRDCRFENLYGFSFHDRGANERIHAIDNTFIECANGLNVNADQSIQSGNTFITSEGIEAAGAGISITNNVFTDAQGVGISIGGNVTPGWELRGITVSGNAVNGVTLRGGFGTGLVIADGVIGAVFSGNVITRSANGGINMTYSAGVPPVDCTFTGNEVFGNSALGASSLIGVGLGGGGKHVFVGNNVWDDGDASWDQRYAVQVSAGGCYVAGNRLLATDRVGTGYCIEVSAAVTCHIGPNEYGGIERIAWAGGSTPVTDTYWGRQTTDKVFEYRRTGQSQATDYSAFAVFLSGKMEWGDQSAVRDTNLYRAAADSLATDDSFTIGQQLALTGDISPGQLVANTDNWAPSGLATVSRIRVSTDASRNLTGLTGGADGRVIFLHNVGAQDLVLKHDVTSTAANRFFCPGSADYTLTLNSSVQLVYDATVVRWRVC